MGNAVAVDAVTRGQHPDRADRLILVGNPNVGKSLIFKGLSGRQVNISNFPGTTVEVVTSRMTVGDREVELVDTPGLNDIDHASEDARVTRRVIDEHPDAVLVQVADAKNLRRALLLLMQLSRMKRPMVLVLNMMDELDRIGGQVDGDRLSEILGIPVVCTVALREDEVRRIAAAVPRAAVPSFDVPEAEEAVDGYHDTQLRLVRAGEIASSTVRVTQPRRSNLAVRFGFWSMHPVKGLVVLGAVMLFVFWFVGLLGAGTLVDGLETGVFYQHLNPLAIRAVDAVAPFPHTHAVETVDWGIGIPLTPSHEIPLTTVSRDVLSTDYTLTAPLGAWQSFLRFLHDLLVGPYGQITMALSYALAIVFPIVTTFFLVFSLLEDSGYLPRLAIMVNRLFRRMGLSGKAVLPMVLGLGCDTMATMTTRILDSRRERLVTTLLLALAVPCSAQLGVLLAMMASLSLVAALSWVGIIVGIMFLVGWLSAKVFDGEESDFILEIPPIRTPQLANVATKTIGRLQWYLREVLPLFALGTGVLFVLDRTGALGWLAAAGEPLVTGWLGLPSETVGAFLIGFLRRDYGAVFLLDAATGPDAILNARQVFTSMVTITLFMPCIANLLMIVKEYGTRMAIAMTAFVFPFAFLVGGIVYRVAGWLGM